MARAARQLQPISEVWEWQLMGRCRDRSGTQFFHPDDDLGRISRRLREAAAKRVCASCPVRAQCATHALRVGEEYGVWGGFSETERLMLQALAGRTRSIRSVAWRTSNGSIVGSPERGRRQSANGPSANGRGWPGATACRPRPGSRPDPTTGSPAGRVLPPHAYAACVVRLDGDRMGTRLSHGSRRPSRSPA